LVRLLEEWDNTAMKVVIRRASVCWTAGAKGGVRAVPAAGGALKLAAFSAPRSRQDNSDTNSAELIAAAHAGSFSQALARKLGRTASLAGDIVTSAAVSLERLAAGWTIVNIHLNVVARLPNVTQGRFIDAAVHAKTNCLVSRGLRATVSMNARLER
jgi:osmotically inducible protein OsmC